MENKNLFLVILSIAIFVLALVIYTKPLPNRYIFRSPLKDSFFATKCEVLDTATGKIYFWTEMESTPNGYQRGGTIEIADPIKNVLIRKGNLKNITDTRDAVDNVR